MLFLKRRTKEKRISFIAAVLAGALCLTILCGNLEGGVRAADGEEALLESYRSYQERFDNIRTMWDISEQGYEIVEKHLFDIPLVKYLPEPDEDGEPVAAEVVRLERPFEIREEDPVSLQQVPTVRFFSAMDRESHRAAVFLADKEGNIVYKCNQLECNYVIRGQLRQPITDIISVAFQDLDQDGLNDIILITGCVNDSGAYAGQVYKVGEVLFQSKEGGFVPEGGEDAPVTADFYRDWRINDKINRFGMNKSAKLIITFVRDHKSTEFLYTATTEKELLDNGFEVMQDQSFWREYEKLGRLKLLPGIYSMAYYDIFMVYLVNEQGDIVWSFQPMGDYDNLYSLRGMSGKDLDGDGMKDMLIVARYSRENENGGRDVVGKNTIYYQRTGGFVADTEFALSYPFDGADSVGDVVSKIRAYWGWQGDEDKNK